MEVIQPLTVSRKNGRTELVRAQWAMPKCSTWKVNLLGEQVSESGLKYVHSLSSLSKFVIHDILCNILQFIVNNTVLSFSFSLFLKVSYGVFPGRERHICSLKNRISVGKSTVTSDLGTLNLCNTKRTVIEAVNAYWLVVRIVTWALFHGII